MKISTYDIQALASLVNATSTDSALPILQGIKISVYKESYKAYATDRYILAQISGVVQDNTEQDEQSFFIDGAAVKDFAKVLGRSNEVITLSTQDGKKLRAESQSGLAMELNPNRVDVTQYPNVEHLLRDKHEGDAPNDVLLNPAYLEKLSKVFSAEIFSQNSSPAKRKHISMSFNFGEDGLKPVLVQRLGYEDTFTGLIVPLKRR